MAKQSDPKQIRDAGGNVVNVLEGSSCDIIATFVDANGAAIAKASLISLVATLFDEATGAAINSRNSQNVLDANNGTVASDGTLTLRLGPSDAAIVGSSLSAGDVELHRLRLRWTWSDGVATRTGVDEWIVRVQKVQAVT